MIRQPVFPGLQRSRCNQGGLTGEGGGLPDDEAGLLAESRGLEICGPVQARRFGREVRLRPSVVGFVDVFVVRQAEMHFRDGMLQLHNALGTGVWVVESRQLQHG